MEGESASWEVGGRGMRERVEKDIAGCRFLTNSTHSRAGSLRCSLLNVTPFAPEVEPHSLSIHEADPEHGISNLGCLTLREESKRRERKRTSRLGAHHGIATWHLLAAEANSLRIQALVLVLVPP